MQKILSFTKHKAVLSLQKLQVINDENNPWQITASSVKYDNPWINVTEFKVINPGGGNGIYGKVHFKNRAIGIVPLDDENNTWLVGQYRFPIDAYSWEIPEGGGSLSEPSLAAAQRELMEETGIKAGKWEKVMEMYLSNSVTDEDCCIYLARELSFHKPSPEETEQLALKKLPFSRVVEMVMSGEIMDAVTAVAVLKVNYLLQNHLI